MANNYVIDGNLGGYFDESGCFILCEEICSDLDSGYHDIDVLNGNGYYDSDGKYCSNHYFD